jgi:release factor glutamine methyltransferase
MSITIKEALYGASYALREAGVFAPRREAELLLAGRLRRPLVYLYAHGEELLDSETAIGYRNWITRRCAGEPYAYLCGEREFMGLSFQVSPACLIPRPETEHLVEAVAAELACNPTAEILEVGTGSGAIAVALAVLLPAARITATDVSAPALSVAAGNAARHGVSERVTFLPGDLYAPLAGSAVCFTAIVSNPPYIPSAELAALSRDIVNFEPLTALDGGADGLHYYRRLTGELAVLSAKPAILAFEVGQGQAGAVSDLSRHAGYQEARLLKDLAGIKRVVLAKRTAI